MELLTLRGKPDHAEIQIANPEWRRGNWAVASLSTPVGFILGPGVSRIPRMGI